MPSRSIACSLCETRDCHRRPSHTLHLPPPSPVSPPLRSPVPWPRPLRYALCGGTGRSPAARCDATGCPAPSLHASRATEQASLVRFRPETDFDSKFPVFNFATPSLAGRSPALAEQELWNRKSEGISSLYFNSLLILIVTSRFTISILSFLCRV